jgi:hypothetical protein
MPAPASAVESLGGAEPVASPAGVATSLAGVAALPAAGPLLASPRSTADGLSGGGLSGGASASRPSRASLCSRKRSSRSCGQAEHNTTSVAHIRRGVVTETAVLEHRRLRSRAATGRRAVVKRLY